MNTRILFIAFFLTVFVASQAKKLEGYIIYEGNVKVKVTFIVPFGFLSSTPSYQKIQQKIKYYDGDKKFTLRAEDAKEISFDYNGVSIRMISVNDNLKIGSTWSQSSRIFLKLEIDGPVRLYDYYFTSTSPGSYNPGTGVMMGGGSYTYDRFVLQKDNGELFRARSLYFKKDMAEFFSDCPELVDKINSKILRKSDLEIIVKEYNSKCY